VQESTVTLELASSSVGAARPSGGNSSFQQPAAETQGEREAQGSSVVCSVTLICQISQPFNMTASRAADASMLLRIPASMLHKDAMAVLLWLLCTCTMHCVCVCVQASACAYQGQ
jgi:hypothetical protein